LLKKPELGGAVVSVRAEAHYLEFNMAASVQGWRKKWFYIKDQKNSSSSHYGIAPFDANKGLKKLSSWDSPSSRIGEIGRRMNSKVKLVETSVYRK
jgi:hypothetical protein